MSTSQVLRILLLLTSGARNLEKLVLLVVVLLLIACLANLTHNLIMEVIADCASCDTVSSTENVLVVEEGSKRKCATNEVCEKIYFDLRSASLPDYKDSISVSSPSAGSDEELYATHKTKSFSSKSHLFPFESPSDLLQSIMDHIFKIAKQDVHQSPQQKEHFKTETPEESMNVKSAIDLNLNESYTSYPLTDQDVGENINQELMPLYSPLVNSYITRRKPRTQYCSPLKYAEQDFLQVSLQDPSLQSAVLMNENIDCNDLQFQDVEISEVLGVDDRECDQGPNSNSQKLPESDDLRSTVCPFCKKDFIYKYRRDRHLVSQACKRTLYKRCLLSTDIGWICELCPTMVFSTKKKATKHAAVHKIKPKTCSVCGEDFRNRTNSQLVQHTRKYHPEFLS